MKNLILSFVFLCICFLSGYAQEKIVWDYPIKPGTKEWAAFETGEQMVRACQIPLEVLNTISTKDLAAVCFNYPLFVNYMAVNDERKGVNATIFQFNGLQELSQRKDGTQELIKVYADYPILSKTQKDINSTDYYSPFKVSFLELVLSDNVFLSKLDNDELEALRKIAVNKYADKLEDDDVYSLYSIKKTMLLIAVIMNKQNKTETQDVVNMFIQNYNHLDANTLTEMSKIITE